MSVGRPPAAAPDTYVYLSDRTDGQRGSFVDLGRVKGIIGSFNYVLPRPSTWPWRTPSSCAGRSA
jgi:hypothetical protein